MVWRMIFERSEKKICSWQIWESRSSPASSKGAYIMYTPKVTKQMIRPMASCSGESFGRKMGRPISRILRTHSKISNQYVRIS